MKPAPVSLCILLFERKIFLSEKENYIKDNELGEIDCEELDMDQHFRKTIAKLENYKGIWIKIELSFRGQLFSTD